MNTELETMAETQDPSSTDPYPLRGTVYRYDDPYGSAFPIEPELVRLDGATIKDWQTFHEISTAIFGFPSFYGKNMNAWIDCMADLRTDSKMSKFLLQQGQMLEIDLLNAKSFRTQTVDVFDGLLGGVIAVNQRFLAAGEQAAISIVFL